MAKRKAKRVYREFTPEEKTRVERARRETEQELPELKAKGRAVKVTHQAARQVLAELRSAREAQGLSLAAVQERSGITREAISKLENSESVNPTVLTLSRYALAVGKQLSIGLVDYDPEVARQMEAAEEIMREDRDVLKRLAE